MALSSTLRAGLCGLTLALSFGVASAADIHVPADQPTIQAAINAAAPSGDRVLVADGIYNEHDIDLGTKNLEVRSESDNPAACIVDAQQAGRGFIVNGGQTNATILRGFTIRNGIATSFLGGGVTNNTSATIANCTFTSNSTPGGGSGIGGGAFNRGTIVNCTFNGNSAGSGGGAFNEGTIANCTFNGNSIVGGGNGGGVFNRGTIVNCTFTGNSAGFGGGAVNEGMTVNCTFTRNSAFRGGGAFNFGRAINSIVFENSADFDAEISTSGGSVESHNLIGGLSSTPDANGNFGGDPRFRNAAGGDFRLKSTSPAIDRGSDAALPSGVATDIRGLPRIKGARVDIGAYEYQPVIVNAGPDQTVTVAHDGNPSTNTASVTLNGIIDNPEGEVVDFRWSGNNNAYPYNTNPTVALPAGVYNFTLTVTEPSGFVHNAVVKITVNPEPNGVPTIHNQSVSIPQDTTATVDVTETDPDGDTLAYAIRSVAVHGTASLSGTTLTYTPNPGFVGTEQIVIGVQDGYGLEGLANVFVTVTDGVAPVITLNGSDPMNIDQGSAFTDPGATATDNVDGSVPVNVSGSVNTAIVGSYTLTYTATDAAGNSSTKTRTVVVKDVLAPVITLNGSDPMTVNQGSAFTDPGATAIDNVDGSVPVNVSGSVNTSVVGSYTLTYTATDAAGNSSSKTRTVNVVAVQSASKIVVSLKELESDDDCRRGRDGGEVEAEFVLRNTGTVAEDNVTITSVSLGGKSPKGRLPKNLGTIRAGKKEDAEFEFKGVRRGTYTLTLSGTSSKGSFSFTQSVTVR